MATRLCKLNRRDIAASLDDIQAMVAQPGYMCRSCARSCADKSALCKPQALAKQHTQPASLLPVVNVDSKPAKAANKAALKLAKKTLKKQKKYHKKLEKVLKKQRKLMRKQQALQSKFSVLQGTGADLNVTPALDAGFSAQMH